MGSVGHIADQPQKLVQPPLHSRGSLLILGTKLPLGQTGSTHHHRGEGPPQLPGCQRQGAKLARLRLGLHQEDIHIPHTGDGCLPNRVPHPEGKGQTAAGKGGIFLLPGVQMGSDFLPL